VFGRETKQKIMSQCFPFFGLPGRKQQTRAPCLASLRPTSFLQTKTNSSPIAVARVANGQEQGPQRVHTINMESSGRPVVPPLFMWSVSSPLLLAWVQKKLGRLVSFQGGVGLGVGPWVLAPTAG